MSLKDASAYNVQFMKGNPIFIDTLSFELYEPDKPWNAYRQFCQHFLAPLALMCYTDVRLNILLTNYTDGIPLELASKLLPSRTKFNFSLLSHIHLHSKAQKKYKTSGETAKSAKVSFNGLIGIIDNLESAIKKMKWKPDKTEWADYYDETNYTEYSFINKKQIVENFLSEFDDIKSLWDLGANNGEFSRLASNKGIQTIAFDTDHAAVEKNYLQVKKNNENYLLPLVIDLTNPSPGIGWGNMERNTLLDRGPVDLVMALALIHHLAISNNIPLVMIAGYLSRLAKYLIIEFVPKSDSKVKFLLSSREDIFTNYNQQNFEMEFSNYFNIIKKEQISESERTIYLMKVK